MYDDPELLDDARAALERAKSGRGSVLPIWALEHVVADLERTEAGHDALVNSLDSARPGKRGDATTFGGKS